MTTFVNLEPLVSLAFYGVRLTKVVKSSPSDHFSIVHPPKDGPQDGARPIPARIEIDQLSIVRHDGALQRSHDPHVCPRPTPVARTHRALTGWLLGLTAPSPTTRDEDTPQRSPQPAGQCAYDQDHGNGGLNAVSGGETGSKAWQMGAAPADLSQRSGTFLNLPQTRLRHNEKSAWNR